jgi:DNA-directed RNA polymerase subunit omega
MNAALVKTALEKVLNANVLINLVSRRVRQLNSYSYEGGTGRPLLPDVTNLCAADIALREIIEGKMGFDIPELIPLVRPTSKDRNRPKDGIRS